MDMKHLCTFRTVAALGSFSQAAEALGFAQSTVSDQIRALEAELGESLFRREKRQAALTPAGELFVMYAQKLINLEAEARDEVARSGEVRGSLSVRVPESVSTWYLPQALKRFQERYPLVDFVFNPCTSHGLLEELRSGITNLAFLITDNFRAPGLETRHLAQIPLVLVASPECPLSSSESVKPCDIAGVPVFAPSSDCSYFKILEKYLASDEVSASPIYRINSVAAIKEAVAGGCGIALLPEVAAAGEIASKKLAVLNLEGGSLSAVLIMIWLKNLWQPPILEAFIGEMSAVFE